MQINLEKKLNNDSNKTFDKRKAVFCQLHPLVILTVQMILHVEIHC